MMIMARLIDRKRERPTHHTTPRHPNQTRALLAAKGNFGMAEGQVTIVKQDKVPALQDAAARLAVSDPYTLDTKPHGHGDVHHLLVRSGLTERWLGEGRKWVFFLQDTNAPRFVLHLLGWQRDPDPVRRDEQRPSKLP